MYSIDFTKVNRKFCLSLHYNGANSYLFANGTEIHKFTANDPESNREKKLDLMVTFMILVLIIIQLQLMTY